MRAAHLASNVRAIIPAATEEEREVPDRVLEQLCSGPGATCQWHWVLLPDLPETAQN